MNYLAHFHLASSHGHVLAGALLGDFIKGNLAEHHQHRGGSFSTDWINSIHFHRQIDTFTDSHPLVIQARQRFESPYRRYAGIIVDLVFDHCLVQQWQGFADQSLASFEQTCYQQLALDEPLFPERAAALSQHLRNHQLLSGYGHLPTIDRALAGVSRRLSKANPLDNCLPAIEEHQANLKKDFLEFYPLLNTACASFPTALVIAAQSDPMPRPCA